MAHKRVEEVFVANHVIGNNNGLGTGLVSGSSLITQTNITALMGTVSTSIHNVVGLCNGDNYNVIANSGSLQTADRVRFFTPYRGRGIRYSDIIDRRKIRSISSSTWRHYRPIVYRLDFSGIASAQIGDTLSIGMALKQEEDFGLHLPTIYVQHTFRATGSGQDVVDIVNKINFVSVELAKGYIPFKAFTGDATGSVIDFNSPNPANLYIYIIAGQRNIDRQNIVQLDIYDFNIYEMTCYKAATETTNYNTFLPIIPTFSLTRGTIDYTGAVGFTTPHPVLYTNGVPTSKGTPTQFYDDNTRSPQNSNGFYNNVLTHLYMTDVGQILGHLNRIFLPDDIELPNINKTIILPALELTDRYNAVHIDYEEHAVDSGQQNQNQSKNKTFTLYYNASLDEPSGNILGNGSYPSGNWSVGTNGLRNLINNLSL